MNLKLMYKIICGLLIVGILSGVAYFLINRNNEKKKNNAGENTLFSFDATTIDSILVDNESGEYSFEKDNNVWNIVDNDENFKVNTYKMDTIAEYMAKLTATQIIEENASDLSAYGLDKPISITCSDGSKKYTILLGNATPTNSGYYVMKPDDKTVYCISAGDGVNIRATRDDLKDLYILDVGSSKISTFYLEKDGKVMFDLTKDSTTGWVMHAPVERNVNIANISSMLELLVRAKVTSFVEEGENVNLAEYGLASPSYKLKLGTEDETVDVYFGDFKGETEIYGLFPKTNQVVTFNIYDLDFFDKSTSSVLNDVIHWIDMIDVSHIDLNLDGKEITMDMDMKNRSDTQPDISINGTKVDSTDEDLLQSYNKFYTAIAGLYFSEVDVDAAPEDKDPAISIEYTLKEDGSKYTIELVAKDTQYYYIFENGEYGGLILDGSTLDHQEGIRNSYNILVDDLGLAK